MSVHFEGTNFGSVTVNGERYKDILVIDGEVIPRDLDMLHENYGTGHVIAPEEVDRLVRGDIDYLIVGTGQSGVLKVTEDLKEATRAAATKLRTAKTPEAIKKFNELVKKGKEVNALIHVTC